MGTGLVVAAALAGGGVAAYAAHGSGPDDYRTAMVAYGDVEQTLALSGTIAPTGRADLSFGTAGTVATVKVGVGDHVTRGQVLARLDTTALRAAVSRANAELAAARAQLARDEDAQAAAVTTSTSSASAKASATPSSAPSQTSSAPSAGAALTKALARLAGQQQAVETAQTRVDAAIGTATDTTKAEQAACTVPATATAPATPTATATATSSASAGADSGADGGSDSGSGSAAACTAAVEAVQAAQQAVADAEYAAPGNLEGALTNLAATLTDAARAVAQAGGQGTGSSGKAGKSGKASQLPTTTASQASQTSQTSQQATGSDATASRGGGRSVTAATLAQDQASIDTAKASLVKATQALAGATITAPASGTVAQVSLARGDDATAGSDAIVVISPGTTTVELSVSDTQVARLEVGQRARVTPAGASQSYAGTVTRIGALPSTSSTGAATYPVTITLTQRDLGLLTGATAAVDVVLGTATHALTVPTSAVSNGSVQVYDAGSVSRTRIATGLVGRSRTVVTGGLEAGQRVVLADASSPRPSSDAGTGRGLGGVRFAGGGGDVVVRP
jgi:HlyD family secretion protein